LRAAGRFPPDFPQTVSPSAFFGGLIGPLLLSASLGVQLTLAAVLVVKPPLRRTELLTQWGRAFYFPERDVELYIAGVLVALGIGLAFTWVWGRIFAAVGGHGSRRIAVGALAVRSAVAVVATAWFLSRWMQARTALVAGQEVSGTHLAVFALIGFLTLAAAAPVELLLRRRSPAAKVDHRLGSGREKAKVGPPGRLRFSALDIVVPLLIFALIYVPDWRQLSGRFFLRDGLLHWDFYAMGPALAFHHGKALGTDFYAMYGLGWPTFFGLLSRWVPLSYGRMMQIGVLYACLYFAGVYLLLRLLLRRPWLAAAGTGLAMLQLVLGAGTEVVWVLPSVTVLRWAFDVWCFIALVMHRTTGKRIWAVAAGALIGLAVFFSTDTGLYLAAAAAFYWLCTAWVGGDRAFNPRDVAWCLAAAAGTLAAGMAVAARGTLFTGDFWSGWLEPLGDYRGGFAQAPLATVPDWPAVACFVVLFFVYLAFAGHSLARVLYRRAGSRDVLIGTFAVYGLMSLIHFVGRSADNTLLRLSVPLALILTVAGGQAYTRAEAGARERWGKRGHARVLFPVLGLVTAVALAALLVAPRSVLLDPVKAYPNLLSRVVRGHEPDGLCLMAEPRDICGLPKVLEEPALQFQSIAGRLNRLSRENRSLAIIDETGSLFYLASGSAPFGRYPRVFVNMYTKQNERKVADSLTHQRPQYVLTLTQLEATDPNSEGWRYFGAGSGSNSPYYPDTYANLLNQIHEDYRLQDRVGPFELWALRTR